MKYIFTAFLFVFFFHTTLSQLKQQQINLSDKNLRLIADASCNGVNNCELCEYKTCMKCLENRVLPNCECALGYVEYLGSCVKCPANCSVCSDPQNCTECDQQYKLESQQCVCATILVGQFCSDFSRLTYNAYVGADQQSIYLEFSDLIRVKNVALDDQFVTSITNCDILDSNTKENYGITQNANSGVGCFIKESHQNVFVIMIGKLKIRNMVDFQFKKNIGLLAIDTDGKLILPKINTQMIQKQQNLLSLSVLSASPNKSYVLNQLNFIMKSCYFQNTFMKGVNSENIIVPIIFQNQTQLSDCSLVSPSNSQPNVECTNQVGLKLETSTFLLGDLVVIEVSCRNMAQMITKDQVAIRISDMVDKISIVPQSDQGTITTMNLQVTKKFQISHGSNTVNDLTAYVSSIPQVFTDYSEKLTSNTLTIQIAPNTFNKESLIYLKIRVSDSNGILTSISYMYFSYQSQYKLTVNQVETVKYPVTDLTFNANIQNYDSANNDLSQFQVQWLCLDFELKLCKYQGGTPQILNQGLQMKFKNFFTPLNSEFTFQASVQRKQDYFTLKIQSVKIKAPIAQLTYEITNPQSNNPNLITFQEYFTIKMIYSLGTPKEGQSFTYQIKMSTETGDTIQIVIDLDTITLNIEDYLPNLLFSLTNPTLVYIDISVVDKFGEYENVINAQRFQIEIRKPPLGCKLNIINTNQLIAFKDSVQMNANSCTNDQASGPFTYQYFFYNSSDQIQEEIINPSKINRQLLSFKQQEQSAFGSVLPPGDLTIMVLIEGKYSVRANFTQKITVKQNDFQFKEYEAFLSQTNSYAVFNKQQQKYQQEVLYYQTFSLAVQYFENKNVTQIPSDDINTMKNSIIQRLQDSSWSSLSEDVYLVSQKTLNIIQNSKIKVNMDVSVSQALKTQNEQNIDKVVDNIEKSDLSQLTTSERTYYKQILTSIVKSYMFNVNNINSWTPEENQNMINYISKALGGISQVMKINDPKLVIETVDSQLQVEKLDYESLISQYFDSADSPNTSAEQKSLNYHVLTQNYPAESKLYKEELSNIHQQYFQNATSQEMLNQIQKTYPIKIPQIFTDKITRRARFLSLSEAQIQVPMTLQFGQISAEEKLKCIQRSDYGKWVTSNCNTNVEIINNQRIIFCSCKKPDITSLTSDIESLFNNKNIRDIFDGSGIERLIHLDGWYKYAPIWTIIGLNIFFVVIVMIGIGFDKRDKKLYVKKMFILKLGLVNDNTNSLVYESSNNDNEGNLFMKIKNNDQSKNTSKQQTPRNKQEQSNDQYQKKNTEKKKKSQFAQTIIQQNQEESNEIVNEINNNQQQAISQKAPQSQNLIEYHNKILSWDQILVNTPLQNNILETQRISNEVQNQNEIDIKTQNFQSNQQKENQYIDSEKQTPNQNLTIIDNFEIQNQEYNNNNQIGYFDLPTPPSNKNPHEILFTDNINLHIQLPSEVSDHITFLQQLPNEKELSKQEMVNKETIKQNLSKTKQISLTDQGQQLEENKVIKENLASIQTQPVNICLSEQQTQIQNLLNTQILRSSIDDKSEQKSDLKKIDTQQKQPEEEAKLFLKAKQKLQDYLSNEGHIKGILAFHIFFSTFIVYDEKFSRAVRFIIYYNKLVWLLALNSVFGVNLSVVQIIILSITSTIVLLIVTIIITALLQKKKLKIIGFVITFIFLLFCYYSILVVISGQDPYDANIWIASYFLTLFINECLIGLLICCAMYYTTKKILNKVESPIILQILGTGMLLEALKS